MSTATLIEQHAAMQAIRQRAEDLRTAVRAADPGISQKTCAALKSIENVVWLADQSMQERLQNDASISQPESTTERSHG